jgi:hypothetical protein
MLYDVKLSLILEMENGDYHTVTSGFQQCSKDFTESIYNNIVKKLISASEQEYNLRVVKYFPIANEEVSKIKSKKDYFYYSTIEDAKIAIAQMKDYYKKINHTLAILKREKDGRSEEERQKFEDKFNKNARLLADMDFVLLFLSNDCEKLSVDEAKKSIDNLISVTSKNSRRNWRFVLESLRENL